MSTKAKKIKCCPYCQAVDSMETGRGVFIEVGEYDGKSYEGEFNGIEMMCSQCQSCVYIP